MNQRKSGKSVLFIAFLFIAILWPMAFAGSSAYAQEATGVGLSAQAGFDGYCKENGWIPVRVTLENNGPDTQGRVQVTYNKGYDFSKVILGEDVLIPGSSRKRLIFYAEPPQGSYNMDISLIVNGKVVADTKIGRSCLGADDMLFGVLSDKPSPYDIVKESDLIRGNAEVAHIQTSDLPDQPQGWSGLDGLIVANVDTGALTDAQRNAMGLWLANGGKLMVIGGPQWQSAAGLKDFLPVEVSSTQTLPNLSALQSYFQLADAPDGPAIVATGKPKAGTDVLVSELGNPLIAEKQVGFGQVIYMAMDPTLEPLSGWDGMKSLYSHLLGAHPVRPEWMDTPWESTAANQALSTLRELGLPSVAYLCGWMVLYVVVIGPINFLILRRRKRREWAWLSIPVLVIVFTAISYFYGNIYRGNRPILNRVAVIQAWDGSEQAAVHALVGVYSPGRATYTVEANNPFIVYPFDTGGNPSIFQNGETTSMQDVRVEIGGMKAVAVDGSTRALPISHNLVLTIDDNDPTLQGSITNNSAYTLHDVMLVTPGDSNTNLGDLRPGGSMKVNLSITPSGSGTFYNLSATDILNMSPYGPSSQNNEDQLRRFNMLQAVLNSSSQGNWGIYLMGWLDQNVVPVSVQGKTSDAVDTSLYVDQLNPKIEYGNGALRLTPGVLAWESSDAGQSPFYNSRGPSSSGYVLSFRPAVPVHFRSVQQLTLNIDAPNYITPGQVQASLWDWGSGQWVPVNNLSWGSNQIAEPAPFAGPSGEVRLRIEGLNGVSTQINESTVTLVVGQ